MARVIEFEGKRLEFPDDVTDAEIASALQGPGALGTAADAAKSLGTGAAKGALGLANIPHLIHEGLNAGNAALAKRFPGAVQPRDTTPLALPTGESLQAGIEGYTGEFHKPQTYAGEWAETIGQFLPAAIGGPGGVATRVATQAVAPALASEGAGHLAKGTAAEVPARIAAALAAGPAAARMAGVRPPQVGPSVEQLKAQSRGVYNDPAVQGMPLSQSDTTALAVRMLDALEGKGARSGGGAFDPLNAPLPFKRAEHVADLQNPTVGDIHAVRKKLGTDAQSRVMSNPAETAASDVAKREVDDFLGNVDPRFKEANANYAAAKRAELVDLQKTKAELRSEAANSGQNISNATRQRMADLLLSDKMKRGFSKGELAQVEKIVEGTATGNAARYVGNLLGGGGGMGQLVAGAALGGAGYGAAGPEGLAAAMLAPLIGRGAKGIEKGSTARQMRKLDEMVRSRSPLGQSMGAPPVDPQMAALVRALLQSSAASAPAAYAGR